MKKLVACFLFLIFGSGAAGQIKMADTLRLALLKAKEPDTVRLKALKALAHYYIIQTSGDSALILAQEGYELALKLKRPKEQVYLLKTIGDAYGGLGDYARCLSIYYKVKEIFHNNNDLMGEALIYNNINVVYYKKKDYRNALSFILQGLKILNDYRSVHPLRNNDEKTLPVVFYLSIGEAYLGLKMVDSADYFIRQSYSDYRKNKIQDYIEIAILHDFGAVEKLKKHSNTALKYFRKAVSLSISNKYTDNLFVTYLDMADLYHQNKQQDSAEYFGQKALQVAEDNKILQDVLDGSQLLYTYYEQDRNLPMAFKYLKLSTAANDSLFSQEKVKQIIAIDFEEREKQHNIENAIKDEQNKIRLYLLIAGLTVFLILTFLFWRESRQRAKTNRQLQKQQQKLDVINQNLESMVYERTKDLQDKNDKLYQYSNYLSHEIRGPISTIKGLVYIEKEGLVEKDEFVKMITECVSDIDNKIVEINYILHEKENPMPGSDLPGRTKR